MAKNVTVAHDKVHSDLYDKVNACTVAVSRLTTEIQTLKSSMAKETDRYVAMLHKAQDRQFKIAGGLVLVILFCVGIIGYGAIGQNGMYTVRNTIPVQSGAIRTNSDIIPPNDQTVYPHTSTDKKK